MKQERLNLYTIDMKYVRDLAKSDSNVMSVSPQSGKDTRPFAGILILVGDKKYCVPLTSPKAKTQKMKNAVDLMKIRHPTRKDENGAFEVIGVLNFNNMLPINESLLSKIDVSFKPSDSAKTRAYKELLHNQLNWCRSNQDQILKKANRLYTLITEYPEENRHLTQRCCNFKKLETVLEKWLEKEERKEKEPVLVASAPQQAAQKPEEKLSFSEMVNRRLDNMYKKQQSRSATNTNVQKKKNDHHR